MWRRALGLVLVIGCGDDSHGTPKDGGIDVPAIDAPTDAAPDAPAADGVACMDDMQCASGHCVANVPSGTGGTCCATACAASDACHVAQCSTGTCQDISIASGACVVTSAGDQLTTCGAAALGCAAPADTDGDNLPDAWEASNNGAGIPFADVDCNGSWNIATEPLLVGASPTVPDIYVRYDYMGYGLDDQSCADSNQCHTLGLSHANDICDGTGQCRHICSQTSECTAAGAEHIAERCLTITNGAACPDTPGSPSGSCACHHTHDPEAIAPGALQAVIDVFALHGVALHIARGQERPHSHVVSFRSDAQMSVGCEGASVVAGTAGIGKYAVSLYDLKSLPMGARYVSRYALFAHMAGCDSTAHCPANPGNSSTCLVGSLTYGQSGMAEIDGGDMIMSLGAPVNDSGLAPGITSAAGFSRLGAAFMHELGHTLGIRHDGHIDRRCAASSECDAGDTCVDLDNGEGKVCHSIVGGVVGAEEPNDKPNYVSIMNYAYQASGIQSSSTANVAAPGMPYTTSSNVVDPALTRLDYSNQVLATLHEDNLDDVPGLGWQPDPLYPGAYLLFSYTDALCHTCPQVAPATGSVDWECANCATTPACVPLGSGPSVFNATSVSADVDGAGVCDQAPTDTLTGHKDWGNFVYGFQCAPSFDN